MEMKRIDFLNDDIFNLIKRISLPAFLGIITNLLFGFVDGIFIGRGIGSDALSGVTIVFPITLVIISCAALFGEGTGSIIARSIPQNEVTRIKKTLQIGHGMTFWMTSLVALIIYINTPQVLSVIGATGISLTYGVEYLRILVWAIPAMALSIVYYHQLNAQGETKIAVRSMVISTSINVILDYFLIFKIDMGVAGAAYATVIAQLFWYAYMHVVSVRDASIYTVRSPLGIPIDKRLTLEMIAIGLSSFIRQVGVALALFIINAIIGNYGSIYVAAFGATQRILRLFIAPIAAVSIALKPIIGQNYGKIQMQRVKRSIKLGIIVTLILGVILFLILILLRFNFAILFGFETNDIELFVKILLYTVLMLPLYGVHQVTSIYFVAIGKYKESISIIMLKQFILLIPLVFLLTKIFGPLGAFLAMPVADLISFIFSVVLLRQEMNSILYYTKTVERDYM